MKILTLIFLFFQAHSQDIDSSSFVQISDNRQVVSMQISMATILYTGMDFDHAGCSFPGEDILDALVGKNLTMNYLVALLYTSLHNSFIEMDRVKFGGEYNKLAMRICQHTFLKNLNDLCLDMRLDSKNIGMIKEFAQSDQAYISVPMAISIYTALFLSSEHHFL